MKMYIHEQGITLVGKAWEIVQKLKEYNKEYGLVTNWVQDVSQKK
ncbi:Z-ring formation inhibitor MciZ [Neobacillus cucumis]|uniref:Z-ring formation inhibitor MciZ n=1 Tax=Neobacillus cucumis TaxID=1740721 RepID=A0A2N5H816_9BACI|nr:Z-ring formation inhibitor MciZ [Neobacillus cucumis]PLS01651.1 Z-ring formation inhibitor MciZ [Neobacillus cucumis]